MISVSFLILYLMEVLRVTCPLFDVNGNLVSSSEDEAAEDLFNGLAKGLHIRTNSVVTKIISKRLDKLKAGSNKAIKPVDYSTIRKNNNNNKRELNKHDNYESNFQAVSVILESGETLSADSVLVTVSLGVLKSKLITFEPPLPQWKQEAIDRLGFGQLNKVVMQFSSIFWEEDYDVFGLLQKELSERGDFYMVWNCVKCYGLPILMAIIAGSNVALYEEMADHLVVAKVIRSYPEAPDPLCYKITRWGKNRLVQGAYSYIPVGSSGEHTSKKYCTTCAGSFVSGIKAAADIIQRQQFTQFLRTHTNHSTSDSKNMSKCKRRKH
ncbi:hypothetical protein Zmor_022083 [Zophobas morio]|uniref:Amine oxidase domain-containing protein n=1 Tax=Zophobas morio TaxID=2755281 RepID=A0AA38HK26_9CUCU|nr:hypothetical protein Zmor_022083 [Zophobas morio]